MRLAGACVRRGALAEWIPRSPPEGEVTGSNPVGIGIGGAPFAICAPSPDLLFCMSGEPVSLGRQRPISAPQAGEGMLWLRRLGRARP